MNTIYELSNWFLFKSSMSHKKIQKLCYYAVAWHYALYNSKILTDDIFEAWIHGPVSKKLWIKYKDSGWNPLPKINIKPSFGFETDEFLEIIYNTYGHFSGHQLESLTHDELPWNEARAGLGECIASNKPINVETMKRYYYSIYEHSQND